MKKIVAGIDGQAISQDVSKAALWAASTLEAPLLLLHAVQKTDSTSLANLSGSIGLGAHTDLLNQLAELDARRNKVAVTFGKSLLQQAQNTLIEHGGKQVETALRHGSIVSALADLQEQARLIVVGRPSQNFSALGSDIEQIIRQARTPILIPQPDFKQPKSFMLAYDGRKTADKAVQRIIESDLLKGLDCHLVCVNNRKKDLEDNFHRVEQLLQKQGFVVQAAFLEGKIFDSLKEYQEQHNIDLLLMGAFSHSKIASVFLGSNTLKMLEQSKVPMIIMQ